MNRERKNKMSKKPAFKMSVSLLNKYLYYLSSPYDNNFKQLVEALDDVYEDNYWTLRGKKFEEEVFEGKHGLLSQLVMPLEKQVWAKKIMDMGNFEIVFNGKIDVLDKDNSIIYDIKRVDNFSENKYDDSATCQHRIYQWFFDNKMDFYYLVTDGVGEKINKNHVVYKERVSDEMLERSIKWLVLDFLDFLNKKELLNKYQEKFSVIY